MVNELIESQSATDAEIAAAQAEAELSLSQQAIKDGETVTDAGTIPGTVRPLSYRISPADQGAWVMVWELKVDAKGQEYGVPCRAPRQQLGLWLQKKREFDGKTRFTVNQPPRIAAEPQFKCLHQECRKRLYTRQDLVDHVENAHGREARLYRKLLDEILEQAAKDNPRVHELARTYATMADHGITSVEINPQPRTDTLDLTAGAPVVTTMSNLQPAEDGLEIFRCSAEGCKRFFDTHHGMLVHKNRDHKG
jgi:hypothetical protein